MQKHKFASISLALRDFLTHRVSKVFPLPKNDSHFEFSLKMEKRKLASISLTVRDRGISSKFSTLRVCK